LDADKINRASVTGIQHCATPKIDRAKILDAFGVEEGNALADKVS